MSKGSPFLVAVRDRHVLFGSLTDSVADKSIRLYSDCNNKDNILLDEQIIHNKPYFYMQGCKLDGKDVDYTWEMIDTSSKKLLLMQDVHASGAVMTIDLGQIQPSKPKDCSSYAYIAIQFVSFLVFYCIIKGLLSNFNRQQKNNVVTPSIVSPLRRGAAKVVRFNLDQNKFENAIDNSMTGLTLDIFDSESWKFIQK